MIFAFVTQFTRPALPVESESQWWLYCIQTGVQLLPTFVYKLANAFIVGENYFMVLQQLLQNKAFWVKMEKLLLINIRVESLQK